MIYLDNSATSFPKPDVVYDFMKDFYCKHGVSPGRSGFDAAIEAANAGNWRAILVDTTRFINNGYGVKLSGSSYASVTRSVFEIGKDRTFIISVDNIKIVTLILILVPSILNGLLTNCIST